MYSDYEIDVLSSDDLKATLNKIIRANNLWNIRATVKNQEIDFDHIYDEDKNDFPLPLIPFYNHPDFLKHSKEKLAKFNAWSWIGYNKNTNDGEELVANPAFFHISKGTIPGTDHVEVKKSVLQAMVDENYHTLLHSQSSFLTKKIRNLQEPISLPNSYSSRQLKLAQDKCPEQWKKDLLTVLFATVSEVSINAHLNLIADAKDIQPMNQRIADLHNRDEYAHSYVCVHIAKMICCSLSKAQRMFFLESLPLALETYVSSDNKTWESILIGLEFNNINEIINDTCDVKNKIIRDYSGLKRLCNELEIIDKVNFDFGS